MRRILCLALCALLVGCGTPAGPGSPSAGTTETRDFGIGMQDRIRADGTYHAPTPSRIPGAQVVTTQALAALLKQTPAPVLIDVLDGRSHRTLPGAVWLAGAGHGTGFEDVIQARLIETALRLAGGDRTRPVVALCLNELCWLSYNAALRLAHGGFTDVRWYRGGVEAWTAAGLPMETAKPTAW